VLLLVSLGTFAQAPPRQWDQSYGGDNGDNLYSVLPAPDGGYLLGGGSTSGANGNKTQPGRGYYDYWVVKTDAGGNKQWDKTYGGTAEEEITSMVPTPDGGYLLGGWSYSGIGGEKSQASRGEADYWIVKVGADGQKQWDKRYGGSGLDYLRALVPAPDGGYLLAGTSYSGQGFDRSKPTRGGSDYWVVKLDANGNKLWDNRYGGEYWDELMAAVPRRTGDFCSAATPTRRPFTTRRGRTGAMTTTGS
jgi:hypothetical protein